LRFSSILITEAENVINDINTAKSQSERAGALASKLAEGSDASIQDVIDNAPAAVEEFQGLYNEAKEALDGIIS
jgi:hypothetical protein